MTGDGATQVQTTFYAQYTPEGAVNTFGPYTPRSDGYTDTRVSGRAVRMRHQPTADGMWGVGTTFFDIPEKTGSGAKR